jgi:gamma-glutamyltranspeptidase/glutathione hydrolase
MTPTIVSEMPVCETIQSPPGIATRVGIPQQCVPGKVRLVLGSPGGSTIITTVVNDLISVVDNGLDIQAAADAPRFHHQYLPDVLQFEKTFPVATVEALKAAGYKTGQQSEFDMKTPGMWGDSELIARDPKTGELLGGQDKRHGFGKAAGY